MENHFETIIDLKKSGEPAALAIIVRVEGSTPRKVGAKMVVLKDGKTVGTLGGGDLEKRVIEEAADAIKQGQPRIASFTLDIEKGRLDMMCGGKLDVYIEPILPDAKTHHLWSGPYYQKPCSLDEIGRFSSFCGGG